MTEKSHIVRYKTVSITVFPVRIPSGAIYWRFAKDGKSVTRSTLAKAKEMALKVCEETYLGAGRVGQLDGVVADRIRRMLAVDPQMLLADEFILWHSKMRPRKSCHEARAEFMAVKRANAGNSPHNVLTLARHLSVLPDFALCDFTPANLPQLEGEPRSRKNRRAAWVTFFRWCQSQGHLDHNTPTAPERLDTPIVTRGIPTTWTPAEMEMLLANVLPQHRAWLACAAFAGIRTEELCPTPGSKKSPVDWSDFDWERKIILIRPETDKNGRKRVIPILPALERALKGHTGEAGQVGSTLSPAQPERTGKPSECKRLGLFVGGWKRNALRHSFISYRAADVGISQAASEAGNSESEARKSYQDAKSKAEALEWFAVGLLPTAKKTAQMV